MELKPLIKAYIKHWDSFIRDREEYKWTAFRHFDEFFYDEEMPFSARVNYSFKMAGNLLVSPNYFPYGMLKVFSEQRPDTMENLMVNVLFNEELPLRERINAYMEETEAIMWEVADSGYGKWKGRTNLHTYQDVHAISVYLAMRYPAKYYIYKTSVFKVFSDVAGYTIQSKNHIDKYLEFLRLCDTVKDELLKETLFLSVYDEWLKAKGYEDFYYCLLTQDFIYAVSRYLTIHIDSSDKSKKKDITKESVITADIKDYKKIVAEKAKSHKGSKIDYESKDKLKRELGLEGELWVVKYEMERLSKLGLQDKVKHVSITEGDGIGYDILSVEDDGTTPRYIEVKTTTGNCNLPLYYSANELEVSQQYQDHYYLYRVYDFRSIKEAPRLIIFKGGLDKLEGTPVSFKACIDI